MLLWLSLVGSYSFDFFLNKKTGFGIFFLLKEKKSKSSVSYTPPHTKKITIDVIPILFFFRPIYYVFIKYKSCRNFL